MICYHCNNADTCFLLRHMYSMSEDFDIRQCKNYDEASKYKYKLIAKDDELMRLIYDYFTDNVSGDHTDEEVKRAITSAIWSLRGENYDKRRSY